MAFTTNQLISGAFYASGVVAREFETVSGGQISDGLIWLNDILLEKAVDEKMIPYETTHTFNSVIAQEEYVIPDLIMIDTLTFTKDNVRYSMRYEKRNEYFGSNRVNSITSLPYEWYFERGFGGGTLYIYFTPDQGYPFQIHGVFRLSSVALGQDLSLTLEQFYITYLRYALADRICAEYNYETPANVIHQLRKYEAFIAKKSRLLDLRMEKVSTLQKRSQYNWAYVNLGRGFTAPY